ncbi:MAG: nucleoside hydrolase [Desulfobacteraceae bacterium]|nr:nucleoside hydrolase [Desulfobacteraceae bacterium]
MFKKIFCCSLIFVSFFFFACTKSNAQSLSPVPIIVDTDMGQDDVVALLYLLNNSDVDIKAITIVATGETSVTQGMDHAGVLCVVTGHPEIPIYGPKDRSTFVPYPVSHDFPKEWTDFNDNGYDTPIFSSDLYKKANIQRTILASQALINTLDNSKTSLSIVALGPLTNLARAFVKDPGISQKIKQLFVMGGAIKVPGNLENKADPHYKNNKRAEWNFFADPGANEMVLSVLSKASKSEKTLPFLVPLDTTNQLPLSVAYVEKLDQLAKQYPKNRSLQIFKSIMHSDPIPRGIAQGWYYLWDPTTCVVAVPALTNTLDAFQVQVNKAFINIDYSNDPKLSGAISVSNPSENTRAYPVQYASKVNAQKIEKDLLDTIANIKS